AMARRLEEAKYIEFAAARSLVERGHRRTDAGFVWSTESRIRRTHTQRQPDEVVVALARRTTAPTLLITARGGEDWFQQSLGFVRSVLQDVEEVSLDGPHHLHISSALPDVVAAIRGFLARRNL